MEEEDWIVGRSWLVAHVASDEQVDIPMCILHHLKHYIFETIENNLKISISENVHSNLWEWGNFVAEPYTPKSFRFVFVAKTNLFMNNKLKANKKLGNPYWFHCPGRPFLVCQHDVEHLVGPIFIFSIFIIFFVNSLTDRKCSESSPWARDQISRPVCLTGEIRRKHNGI